MISFVLLAAALTLASVVAVAIPLLRSSTTGAASAPWTALAAAGLLVAGSAALYVTWSKWSWRAAPAADSPQNMVAQLARRLEHDPTDLNGWLMLGRSYTALQEYPLAVRAFGRAVQLSDGKNAEALSGEAEALALSDESELDGRAARPPRPRKTTPCPSPARAPAPARRAAPRGRRARSRRTVPAPRPRRREPQRSCHRSAAQRDRRHAPRADIPATRCTSDRA